MQDLIKKAKTTNNLTAQELALLIKNDEINNELFSAADEIRRENVGDVVHLRALVEFSNYCKQNCFYCGLRVENNTIERYRLTPDEIISTAQKAVALGYKTIVLQSGEDESYSIDALCKIVEQIKSLDVVLTLSIGEKPQADYEKLFKSGADRYLLRIETTNKELYKKLHPKMDYENRVRCLKDLKALGFELGTGCLIGLPEQTAESLADDISFFKMIGADMVGMGPFISNDKTPLAKKANGDFTLALKMVALTRLLLPKSNIPATTAMETLSKKGRLMALQAGANVVMPNLTDPCYSKNYNIYPNKASCGTDCKTYLDKLTTEIKNIGRTVK